MKNTIKPRTKTPELELPLVGGETWQLSEQHPKNYTMIVVYRGLHCPVCKKYLKNLQSIINDYKDKGVNVVAMSSDTKERAIKAKEDWEIEDVPVAYNFSTDEARSWGLFISEGIKEEPKEFIEPGLFLIEPDGTLYCSSIQTMPFARPDLEVFLKKIEFILEEDYPARGES